MGEDKLIFTLSETTIESAKDWHRKINDEFK
jgi:hypothetical protein